MRLGQNAKLVQSVEGMARCNGEWCGVDVRWQKGSTLEFTNVAKSAVAGRLGNGMGNWGKWRDRHGKRRKGGRRM